MPESRKELNKEIWQKLDGGLRRLLVMTDDAIKEKVDITEKRLAKKAQKLRQATKKTAQDKSKGMLKVIERAKIKNDFELLPHPVFGATVVDKDRPVKVRTLVEFSGNQDDLASLGLKVRTQAREIYTLEGTVDQLRALAQQSATFRMRLPRLLLPTVNSATTQAEINSNIFPSYRNVNLGHVPYKGEGVIIGIIDTALDIRHHTFRDPDPAGSHGSRVVYYWVQDPYTIDPVNGDRVRQPNAPGQDPQLVNPQLFDGLDYGRLYDTTDINTAIAAPGGPYGTQNNQICCEPYDEEHGTHVAGIAAGSGHEDNWQWDPKYIGAAPKADLIHVCLSAGAAGFDSATFETNLAEAIDFIFRAAEDRGQSVVINVSQGTSLGPHNGTSLIDRLRSNLVNSSRNRFIVWAAGNDHDARGFVKGTISSYHGTIKTLTVTPISTFGQLLYLDIWYSGPVLDVEVDCTGISSGWRTNGTQSAEFHGTLNGYQVDLDRNAEPLYPGAIRTYGENLRNIRLQVEDAINADPWTVRLRTTDPNVPVQYYAWVGIQGWQADLSPCSYEKYYTLSDLACEASILTVGACKKVYPPNPATVETIAEYSAAGPTLDGRIKPEVVAIGGHGRGMNEVMSARSSGIFFNGGRVGGISLQNQYIGMHGTSMASPLVAGAVALLFEKFQKQGIDINHTMVKSLLAYHAICPQGRELPFDVTSWGELVPVEDHGWRGQYGYGRLRMGDLLDRAWANKPAPHFEPKVDLWIRTAIDDLGQEPYVGNHLSSSPDILVFDQETNRMVTELSWGHDYHVRITVRNRGYQHAMGAEVRLKYTVTGWRPETWTPIENASNGYYFIRVGVPAFSESTFSVDWRPEREEINGSGNLTTFSLVSEVHHEMDPLQYPSRAPSSVPEIDRRFPSSNAEDWEKNIRGTNNIAVRMLRIT